MAGLRGAQCPIILERYRSEGNLTPYNLQCGHTASERTCPMCRKAMTGTTLADYNMNYALRDAVAPNTDEWLLSPGAIELPHEPFPPGTFLGRGGSGMVVRGTLLAGGVRQAVAIKIVELRGCSEAQIAAAKQEIVIMCDVSQHLGSCVVEFKGFQTDSQERLLIVMGLAQRSLMSMIAEGDVSLTTVVAMAHQVADSLRRLHAMGVLHKDVSPGNILQSASGVWHLADFGISTMCTSTLGIANQTHMTCNLDYAAPEQFNPSARVTDRSDVWCLAASMLHALTGSRPYGNVSMHAIMASLYSGTGPAIPADDLPGEVVEVLTACLTADPSQRPSAVQLVQILTPLHAVGRNADADAAAEVAAAEAVAAAAERFAVEEARANAAAEAAAARAVAERAAAEVAAAEAAAAQERAVAEAIEDARRAAQARPTPSAPPSFLVQPTHRSSDSSESPTLRPPLGPPVHTTQANLPPAQASAQPPARSSSSIWDNSRDDPTDGPPQAQAPSTAVHAPFVTAEGVSLSELALNATQPSAQPAGPSTLHQAPGTATPPEHASAPMTNGTYPTTHTVHQAHPRQSAFASMPPSLAPPQQTASVSIPLSTAPYGSESSYPPLYSPQGFSWAPLDPSVTRPPVSGFPDAQPTPPGPQAYGPGSQSPTPAPVEMYPPPGIWPGSNVHTGPQPSPPTGPAAPPAGSDLSPGPSRSSSHIPRMYPTLSNASSLPLGPTTAELVAPSPPLPSTNCTLSFLLELTQKWGTARVGLQGRTFTSASARVAKGLALVPAPKQSSHRLQAADVAQVRWQGARCTLVGGGPQATLVIPPNAQLIVCGDSALTLQDLVIKGERSVLRVEGPGSLTLERVRLQGCSIIADSGATVKAVDCTFASCLVAVYADGAGTSVSLSRGTHTDASGASYYGPGCEVTACDHAVRVQGGALVMASHMRATGCGFSACVVTDEPSVNPRKGVSKIKSVFSLKSKSKKAAAGAPSAGSVSSAGHSGTQLDLEGCVIASSDMHGVFVVHGGKASLAECTVKCSAECGALVGGVGSELTATGRCYFQDNTGAGVRVQAGATLTAMDSYFVTNKCGVVVKGVSDAKSIASEAKGASTAALTRCVVSSNTGNGVFVSDTKCRLTATQCKVADNRGGCGVYVLAAADATLTACELEANSGNGVRVRDPSSRLTAKECAMTRNGEAGACAVLHAAATFHECRLLSNAFGMRVSDSTVSVTDCTLANNTWQGIQVECSGEVALRACTVTGNVLHNGSVDRTSKMNAVACTVNGVPNMKSWWQHS